MSFITASCSGILQRQEAGLVPCAHGHKRAAEVRREVSRLAGPSVPQPGWVRGVLTIWSARSSTVLRLNLREQKLKRSSRLGPSSSMTMTL